MSHRHEQLESTLKRAVQEVVGRGLQDPRARGLITVTDVKLSRDLKNATVLVSVLPDERQTLTLHALRHAAAHIRREVGDAVAMRQMPQLEFRADLSIKKQAEVFQALARASAELAEKRPPADADGSNDGAPPPPPPGEPEEPRP